MASTFIIMGNKLKLMIEQTKIHAEALKDSAVTQAKIQAENEKAEVQPKMQCFLFIFGLEILKMKFWSAFQIS